MTDPAMTPARMAEIHRQCFSTPRPWDEREFADLVARPETILVATGDGFLVGREIAGEAEVMTLAVLPACRRRGLGRRLLAEFESAARRRGARTVFLEVAEQNHPAIALYRKAGYAQAGFRRDYYRHPDGKKVSALVMFRKFHHPEPPSQAHNRQPGQR